MCGCCILNLSKWAQAVLEPILPFPEQQHLFLFYNLQQGLFFFFFDEPDISHMAEKQDIIVALDFRQRFMIIGATQLSHLGCSYF